MTDKTNESPQKEDKVEKVEAQPKAVEETTETPKPRSKPMIQADDEMHVYFEQGRTAALGGISKEDAPHEPSAPEYKAWLKGWNFAHG